MPVRTHAILAASGSWPSVATFSGERRMLMTAVESNELPDFLQSYEDLNSYIRDTLDQLDNTKKGRSFARFVSKVIPIYHLGDRFTQVELGQDSRDGGVDLTSVSIDNTTVLYGQAKLTISRV